MSARQVYVSEERDRIAFAEQAARSFKANPQYWTFSRGAIEPGAWLALRWGLCDDCVLVIQVGDAEPVNYAQLVRTVEGAPSE